MLSSWIFRTPYPDMKYFADAEDMSANYFGMLSKVSHFFKMWASYCFNIQFVTKIDWKWCAMIWYNLKCSYITFLKYALQWAVLVLADGTLYALLHTILIAEYVSVKSISCLTKGFKPLYKKYWAPLFLFVCQNGIWQHQI